MNFLEQRRQMVNHQLRARGITDSQVLDAFLKVPREVFVPRNLQHLAYIDAPLAIGHDQTISQPYTVAVMTEALGPFAANVKKGKVLEVGTGSGYQAAILAQLFDRVVSIECVPALVERARQILAEQGIENVKVVGGDGSGGWPEGAPYDAIVVTAAGPKVPQPLLDQLAEGGRLVMPVGGGLVQETIRLTKTKDGVGEEGLGGFRFVPLVGEYGWGEQKF